VTLPAQPSAAETKELDALWQQIRAFGAHVAGLSYQEIHDRIVGYEEQLLGIVQKYAKPAAPADNTAPSSAPSTSATSGGPNSSTSAGNSVAPTTSSAATSSAPPTQSSSSATSSATSSAPSTSAATSSEPPTVSGTP
jgi:putative peptide zinc metalloprotease protein